MKRRVRIGHQRREPALIQVRHREPGHANGFHLVVIAIVLETAAITVLLKGLRGSQRAALDFLYAPEMIARSSGSALPRAQPPGFVVTAPEAQPVRTAGARHEPAVEDHEIVPARLPVQGRA